MTSAARFLFLLELRPHIDVERGPFFWPTPRLKDHRLSNVGGRENVETLLMRFETRVLALEDEE